MFDLPTFDWYLVGVAWIFHVAENKAVRARRQEKRPARVRAEATSGFSPLAQLCVPE